MNTCRWATVPPGTIERLYTAERPCFIHIPKLVESSGVPGWAAACASSLAASYPRRNEEFLEFATELLTWAQDTPRPDGFDTRIMVSPDIVLGHTLLDIQFRPYSLDVDLKSRHWDLIDIEATPDECWRGVRLIYGRDRSELVGQQVVRQWRTLDGDIGSDYVCVVNRPESPFGPIDVVAVSATRDIDHLVESMSPIHSLLLGDEVFAQVHPIRKPMIRLEGLK